LGNGYSAIVGDAGRLYTMYRQGDEEIVIALQADTGRTLWEHHYEAKPYATQTGEYGHGPGATPLMLGEQLITVGFTGIMHCLDTETGSIIWSRDLITDFRAKAPYYGYANSPLAYRGMVIAPVGGEDAGVVALNAADGLAVWKSKPCEISYAAPTLINVDGQDQIVFFTPDQVIGISAREGSSLWSHQVVDFCKTNCTSAVWGPDNLLWAATKGVGGARVLRLAQSDGVTNVEQVWLDRKIRVHHWNAVRVGDFIYTSSGDARRVFSVIDVKTGKVVVERSGYGSTNGIYADGKLILLDDNGQLILARVSPGDIEVVSSVQLLEFPAWTAPTLVGTRLYVRDRRNIVALDLSRDGVERVSQEK